MSSYTVMKCLHRCTIDPEAARRARTADATELAAEYGLTPQEAVAIVEGRVDILFRAGVHPMSLVQLSRIFGFSITRRWQELADTRQ
ncbi:hypothetical protein AB0M32_42390 [Streptomyces sp. NPDC051985]|uniref:hypothetical protein n=1 Tax=Streptomyces sp. NPDC051985 TaxID=3155807 RepID=UPI0034157192